MAKTSKGLAASTRDREQAELMDVAEKVAKLYKGQPDLITKAARVLGPASSATRQQFLREKDLRAARDLVLHLQNEPSKQGLYNNGRTSSGGGRTSSRYSTTSSTSSSSSNATSCGSTCPTNNDSATSTIVGSGSSFVYGADEAIAMFDLMRRAYNEDVKSYKSGLNVLHHAAPAELENVLKDNDPSQLVQLVQVLKARQAEHDSKNQSKHDPQEPSICPGESPPRDTPAQRYPSSFCNRTGWLGSLFQSMWSKGQAGPAGHGDSIYSPLLGGKDEEQP